MLFLEHPLGLCLHVWWCRTHVCLPDALQAFELALLDPSAGESVSAGLSAARDVDEAGWLRYTARTRPRVCGSRARTSAVLGRLAPEQAEQARLSRCQSHTQLLNLCVCLLRHLVPPTACCCVLTDGEAPAPSSDSRADLLLDVMIGTLCTEGEPPSLAHLLLGFDVNSIPTEWWQTELHPEHDLSCLSVVLRALQVKGPVLKVCTAPKKQALWCSCSQAA